jgi:cytochrome c oxidase subunit 1
LHLITAVGGFLVFAGIVFLVYNLVVSARRGRPAGSNPWGSRTLEWTVSSPPPENNFANKPEVFDHPHQFGVPGSVHSSPSSGKDNSSQEK